VQLNDILQSLNREEKEIERYMEGYIAFMRHCKCGNLTTWIGKI
jgi:hypothetical protein